MNALKTGILLVLLTVLLVAVGQVVGGSRGATTAFFFALAMNFISYWFSDKIVLAMYRATPLSESAAPQIYRIVNHISSCVGIPMPKLFLVPSETPNAFATGRSPKHASVAVTSALLDLMNEEELEGVLAHELSHVLNRDTLVMTVAAAIAGAVMWLAHMARWGMWMGGGRDDRENRNGSAVRLIFLLLIVILAPLAATLIQLAISRTREYGADDSGARLTGNPEGLAQALEKLDQAVHRHPMLDANPATAHLFIVNPLSPEAIASLFSTHPPIRERIRRLRSLK